MAFLDIGWRRIGVFAHEFVIAIAHVDPNTIDSELLTRYITGEADESQRLAVEQWAATSNANREELERLRNIWSWSENAVPLPEFDVDVAYAKVTARIDGVKGRVIPIGRARWVAWLAAAAAIAGLVFAAQLFWRDPRPEVLLADAAPVTTTLKDNSNVVLSARSRMEVSMGVQRQVKLMGEAYFEVKRDEQRPFTITTDDVLVTVLGTAFTVTAYDTSEFVLVRVRSGSVHVEGGDEAVRLQAGEHVRYHRKRHILERIPAPPAEVWGLRVLQFEDATLQQVIDQLQRIYDVRIDLRNPAIGNCKYTAEFDSETIGYILRVISDTFGLELTEPTDGVFILDGDGC